VEKSIIDRYIRFRSNPSFDNKQDSYFCTKLGISLDTLDNAKMENSGWAKRVLKARRTRYAEKMIEIDKALFLAAKSGDTKAADLLYRRFDGWNPKIVEQNNTFYDFASLVKGLRNDNGASPTRGRKTVVRKLPQ